MNYLISGEYTTPIALWRDFHALLQRFRLLHDKNRDLLTMAERKPRDRLPSITLSIKQQSERLKLEPWFRE